MTGTRAMFLELTNIDRAILTVDGYADIHVVEGVGSVLFQLESRRFLEIGGVLFVPQCQLWKMTDTSFFIARDR